MIYEFKGIVKELSPVEERGNFRFTTLVVTKTIQKRDGGTFEQNAAIQFSQANIDRTATLKPGDDVTVKFDVRSKEHNGRWFTNLDGQNVEINQSAPAKQNSPAQSPMMDPPMDDSEPLPF